MQRAQYADTVQRNQPFYGAGTDALAMLQQKLPGLNTGYDPQALLNEPGYQFGLQQGQQALERSLAARGRGVSGAALKAASEFGNNYATGQLNSAFNRDQAGKNQQFSQLMQLTGLGQASANNTSAAGQNYANQAGANLVGAGNSAGANAIAQGNIWSGLVNQGASAYGRMNSGGGSGAFQSTPGVGSVSAGGSPDGYWADGGPVRAEPKIGTRAPVRTGGGGGLSREAILAALDEAHQQGQQRPSGVGALPANPVTQPGAILADRMQRGGAYAKGGQVSGPIKGAGTETSDSIAVPMQGGGTGHLSNNEHVITAEEVAAFGDGDMERGHALLNELRQRIKAHNAGKTGKH